MTIPVSDPLDPRLADYRNVPDSALVERRGIFVAEGRLVVQRLLRDSPYVTRSAMVTATALDTIQPAMQNDPDVPIYVVPQAVMNDVAGFHVHRGVLAIGERPATIAWRALARESRRLVILERVGDADNVGSVFRHAAAFGADAVLLAPATADPLYRKAIRTSMGATLVVPFARIDRPGLDDDAQKAQSDEARSAKPEGDWPGALRELGLEGVAVVALTPSSAAPSLRAIAHETAGRRVALVLGHEGDGLTQAALDACTHRASIPMAAAVDSINVAAAAAIALYEIANV